MKIQIDKLEKELENKLESLSEEEMRERMNSPGVLRVLTKIKEQKLSDITTFNTNIKIGDKVVCFPIITEHGMPVFKNGKRTFSRSSSFINRSGTPVVFLDGVGMVSVYHVLNYRNVPEGENVFDEKFDHKWED